MKQAIFTFSPDGGNHVYAFTPSGRIALYLLTAVLSLIGCIALALVQVYGWLTSIFLFVLTAPVEQMLRLGVGLLIVLLISIIVRVWTSSRAHVGVTV